MHNNPGRPLSLPGLEVEPFDAPGETSRFDLVVFVAEQEGRLVTAWLYDRDLFDASDVADLGRQFETLLRRVSTDPGLRLSEIDLSTDEEKKRQIMEKQERRQNRATRLKSIRRREVDLLRGAEVAAERIGESELPLVLCPASPGIDATAWAAGERARLGEDLRRHGAILFRGFDIANPRDFERFAESLCPELFGEYGDLPREELGGRVYGSTPYPTDQPILFHNESSHMHRWPRKIFFFCMQAAARGGETPIVDCRRVHARLDPELARRFRDKGLLYVRNYTEGLDVSWQSFYGTPDRARVEEICRAAGTEFEWVGADGLRTRQRCPAVVRHPVTGEQSFFNQLQLHHVSCLEPAVRESLLSMMREEELPRNVFYGDGSTIEDSVMEKVGRIYRENAVEFPWQPGDVLMVDNMLVAHSRNPYEGARKIVVAMGEMFEQSELGTA
jgi:alpha-ketoglutarate-dependent taurine dioxygenase